MYSLFTAAADLAADRVTTQSDAAADHEPFAAKPSSLSLIATIDFFSSDPENRRHLCLNCHHI